MTGDICSQLDWGPTPRSLCSTLHPPTWPCFFSVLGGGELPLHGPEVICPCHTRVHPGGRPSAWVGEGRLGQLGRWEAGPGFPRCNTPGAG